MTPESNGWDDRRLPEVFERYRLACGVPEGGANFMPGIWSRIEAKRSRTRVFEKAARVLCAVSVGLSLVFGVFLALPNQQPSVLSTETFVEQIASDNSLDSGAFFEPVSLELTPAERHHRR